jgi:predicted DNA-binding transcriptional regulator AlpA
MSTKTNKSKKTRRDDTHEKVVKLRPSHPLNLFRPHRLAQLLSVDPATVWRWRKDGTLPEPVVIGGIKGWTEDQLRHLLHQEAAR